MSGIQSPNERLLELFAAHRVVDLPTIRAALGGVSSMTAFRHLKRLGYRCSYNHKGRYYARHEPARYDRFGLWSVGDIHFSVDGTLRNTVRRLVEQAPAGATHQELHQRLRVRVHNTLLDLLRQGEVERERLVQVFVYLHIEPEVRAQQLEQRRELITAAEVASVDGDVPVSEQTVIEVLLTLIRHPGANAGAVARRLRARSPPISATEVRAVFARYELGEKGGPAIG